MPVSKISWRIKRNRRNKHIANLLAAAKRPRPTVLAELRQHMKTAEIGVDPIHLNGVPYDIRMHLRHGWTVDSKKWDRAHPVPA
jgi:hypothetical protein